MENKQIVLKRMLNVIKGQAMYVKDNTLMTVEDKLEQCDVLLNIMKYVQHYDEYTAMIQEHEKKKNKLLGKEINE